MENTKEAFAGESQANRKYLAFSEKAAAEGFNSVATLYKAASEAEAIHAKKLLKVLAAIESTEKNLDSEHSRRNLRIYKNVSRFCQACRIRGKK